MESWIDTNTILLVRHGSHAYGLNIESSDLDVKGVCIEPIEYHLGFLHSFEQLERMTNKGHAEDKVIYSLKKFAKLAADCNPNIIEVLNVDDSDVLSCDSYGETLREHCDKFLSKRAMHTFSGYAQGQLKRIKTHRSWLLDPPKSQPNRADFGLPDKSTITKSELGAFNVSIEKNLDIEVPENVLTVLLREKQYNAAKIHWDQYRNWLKTRNPQRAALEQNFGFDTKHAMHLIRLMRMCREILELGRVIVKRPDRDELLAIRSGQRSYDDIIEEAEKLMVECERLYSISKLPRESDRKFLDDLIVDLTSRFLKRSS